LNSVCGHLLYKSTHFLVCLILIHVESIQALRVGLQFYESAKPFDTYYMLSFVAYPVVYRALQVVTGVAQLNNEKMVAEFPYLSANTMIVHKSDELKTAQTVLNGKLIFSSVISAAVDNSAVEDGVKEVVPKGVLPPNVDLKTVGLISALRLLFNAAIAAAFPESLTLSLESASVVRCANAAFGDFQCNNALALSKALKTLQGYVGMNFPLAYIVVAQNSLQVIFIV
jgi:hypothetical protein